MKAGQPLVYVDPVGVPHHALVTIAWGNNGKPTVNLVFVEHGKPGFSQDMIAAGTEGRINTDHTSVTHRDDTSAPGRFYLFSEEPFGAGTAAEAATAYLEAGPVGVGG